MNKAILFILLVLPFSSFAQKEAKKESRSKKNVCDSMIVDFAAGTINGIIDVNSPVDSIKKYFTCELTAVASIHEDEYSCGEGLLMDKRGVFFNPEKGFIEFREDTRAKLPVQIFGMTEDEVSENFPNLMQVSDLSAPSANTPTESVYLFPQSYGSLAIWINLETKRAYKVQMHNKPFAEAFLCIE